VFAYDAINFGSPFVGCPTPAYRAVLARAVPSRLDTAFDVAQADDPAPMDDFLGDLGFTLDEDDGDDDDGPFDSSDVLHVARRFKSGRSAAQLVYGDGALNVGAGAMSLDWAKAVDRMLSTGALDERVELARALGQMSRVASHADRMREAGVVAAMAELLMHDADDVVVAAAEAIGHLCCANAANRDAAGEAGVIPRLIQMLDGDLGTEGGVTAVGAAAAALRNLTYQHEANQAALCAGGGMELLLRVVATGEHRLGRVVPQTREGLGRAGDKPSPEPGSHPTPSPTVCQASRPRRRPSARRGARRHTAPLPLSRTSRPRRPTRRASSRPASCPRCRRCCLARRPRR
jgi:hypothetical protein